jgi:serine/threonine protein phosphatase PrpC
MIIASGTTHPGRVRSINEDTFFYDVEAGLFIVADGMGGRMGSIRLCPSTPIVS